MPIKKKQLKRKPFYAKLSINGFTAHMVSFSKKDIINKIQGVAEALLNNKFKIKKKQEGRLTGEK